MRPGGECVPVTGNQFGVRVPLSIDYESEGFPATASVANGAGTLTTSWDDLLWAAVTVGRPNRQYVFRHGLASAYEALFRWSLVRMALEQTGQRGRRLRRTAAARTLDPSEKGAVNYFLGLAVCKLFAARLLDVPWLLHLDVFRPRLDPVLKGRSRPDLVGKTTAGAWIALECKGRISAPSSNAKDRAKDQAERVVSVSGVAPTLSVGGITFFKKDILHFFWRDPTSEPEKVRKPLEVTINPADWRAHYAPVLGLIQSNADYFERMQQQPVLMPVAAADIEVGIHPTVLRALSAERWEDPRELLSRDVGAGYQRDGVAVRAGTTWTEPFEESS